AAELSLLPRSGERDLADADFRGVLDLLRAESKNIPHHIGAPRDGFSATPTRTYINLVFRSSECALHPRVRLLPAPSIKRERFRKFEHFATYSVKARRVIPIVQRFGDPSPHLPHLRFLHPSRSQRRSANANAARLHRRVGIKRNCIFVYGNRCLAQC